MLWAAKRSDLLTQASMLFERGVWELQGRANLGHALHRRRQCGKTTAASAEG